jgi:hypothetical protein
MPVRPTEQHQHESGVGEGDDTNADVHPNVTGDTNINANVNANANTSPEGVHILGGEFGATANQSTLREGSGMNANTDFHQPGCLCERPTQTRMQE